jgi:hypothetical protein
MEDPHEKTLENKTHRIRKIIVVPETQGCYIRQNFGMF